MGGEIMSWFDRGILIALVFGVWALVLKPDSLTAHHDNEHVCTFSWSGGYGERDGAEVYIHSGNGDVECFHF